MKTKRLIASILAGMTVLGATCVSAFAETIYGYTYIPETGEVVESQMDSSEMPQSAKVLRYTDEDFNVSAPVYPQAARIPVDIELDSDEEYIWVEFDDSKPWCRLKLRNMDTGAYAVDWTPEISIDRTYFQNFPAGNYRLYIASTTVARHISGWIYTQ